MVTSTLFTYGYSGGGSMEDLLAYVAAGATIVDCRFSPNSRVPTWRKEHLEAALGEEYIWIHTLGNRNYRGGGPVEIADLPVGLCRLEEILEVGSVVLLCGCTDWRQCHRAVVGDAATKQLGVRVHHLAHGERLHQ